MSETTPTLRRVAIVNRGEPAMRLINAVREWNAEGRAALTTIALFTAVDRHAMFVREADEAVLIGPDEEDQAFGRTSPYLDLAELERALLVARADAVWPGWGFVREKAEFAELCGRLGITFIGPSPRGDARSRRQDRVQAAGRAGRACRWPRGAAGRCRTWPRPASTRRRSATR